MLQELAAHQRLALYVERLGGRGRHDGLQIVSSGMLFGRTPIVNLSAELCWQRFGVIVVEWSQNALQDVFGSIRCSDLKFSDGVDSVEGQSGDESPHSKICQARASEGLIHKQWQRGESAGGKDQ